MRGTNHGARDAAAWRMARAQHGVVARRQLLGLGFSPKEIERRIARRRLHPIARGIYAVGRRELSPEGGWMAAVLACGPTAVLSHRSAGALFGIPITSPVQTMIDLATEQGPKTLLRSINEADKLEVIEADRLRLALEDYAGQPGVRALRKLLDRDTFVLSDEELERLFLPLALGVGLSLPQTKVWLNGYEVDFFWPELKLVVETDGLRYHRTPSAQARDLRRDQTHTAAGFSRLRFSHWQVKHEGDYVRRILASTASRLNQHG